MKYEEAACLAASLVFSKALTYITYIIPNRFRTMRMTAITSSVWIQLPVFGKLGLMLPPKKPSSHRINRITMIVHNMRFLLLGDWLITHHTINTPRPHPSAGECLSPPVGGDFFSALDTFHGIL